jgi:signal peptidase I
MIFIQLQYIINVYECRRIMIMKNKAVKELFDWILSIVIAVVAALCIKAFLFDIIEVSGDSMIPTLHGNDRLAVERLCRFTHTVKRGQIVIFDSGDQGNGIYIKRVIALPGDEIEINDGVVFLNDEQLQEDYLPEGIYTSSGTLTGPLIIPDGYIFVLGDNREVSEDSRYIGCVPYSMLRGRVLFRIYPFNNARKFN